MTAASPPSQFRDAKQAAKTSRLKDGIAASSTRFLLRRKLAHWFAPLMIAAALGAAHLMGLFVQVDGRFFDEISLNRAGNEPQVVVIERDAAFEAGLAGQEVTGFQQLDRALSGLGVERVGYLDAPNNVQTGAPPSARLPVIVALPARALPSNGTWEVASADLGAAVPSARTIAASEYGINRSQRSILPGLAGPIPVFDSALANVYPARSEFLVPMPRRQSIPVLKASQITGGQFERGELDGLVAMVAASDSLNGSLTTAIDPHDRTTSEAIFRAHAINALRSGEYAYRAVGLEIWLPLLALGLILAVLFRQTDPKRLAITIPLSFNILTLGVSYAVLLFSGLLLPVSALLLAPWIITFQQVLQREAVQDERLEKSASRAVQVAFNRSALREGARLPQFLGSAAQFAGVERSLLIELKPNGKVEAVAASNASLEDIELSPKRLAAVLKGVRENFGVRSAAEIVPGWGPDARIGWIGSGDQQLFWLHTKPDTPTPGKSAQLVRAIATSFRELFRWRADLNARDNHEARREPIDSKVSSAIALVASESEQIRRGLDTTNTAVIIFHLIGSPLHANSAMKDIYAEAGLNLFDTSLADALLALTDLDESRVQALIEDLMLNGSEMRMPMRDLGRIDRPSERMLRLAAPSSHAHGGDRVLVLEAIDIREANRAGELRKAVAKFIDLQLRNDLEAILLGSRLASDRRLGPDQLDKVVSGITETAHRATGRLDEVAGLVRSETNDLTQACYPVDATAIAKDAVARVAGLAEELGVSIEVEHPGISSFTLAEPVALNEMLVAMLRVVIADTPHGGVVKFRIEELEERTHMRISGGFGIGFDRLLWLIANYEEGAVGEYRVIGEGMKIVTGWSASVSYWGSESNGFGFNVDLRGVG